MLGFVARVYLWLRGGSVERRREVERLKGEVLAKVGGGAAYLVPFGFLDESLDTTLHEALRELRSEGRIVTGGLDGRWERWVAS